MDKETNRADYTKIIIKNHLLALESSMKEINESLHKLMSILQEAHEKVIQLEDRKEKLEIQK